MNVSKLNRNPITCLVRREFIMRFYPLVAFSVFVTELG